MSRAQVVAIVALALPALLLVLWPLLRRGRAAEAPGAAAEDPRLEMAEEKAAIYRALRELAFDHEAGHLSDDDYQELRARYEGRAAEVLHALDALGPAERPAARPAPAATAGGGAGGRGWTRSPAAVTVGALALVAFGLVIGLNVGRFTEPEPGPTSAASPPLVPMTGAGGGPATAGTGAPGDAGRVLPPEVLAGMLRAARQSLSEGRYQEAIAAYQAVLKRDTRNVDAMTHLGLIVAMGGHVDSALETWDKALRIDPDYAPAYLYRGQVLYETKQDYPAAITAWQRFVTLVPKGEEHDRVVALIQEAQTKQRPR